ncbi:MAG: hypothetical protein QXS20_00170 [Candidatus Thorarchaeota archaeon]
MVTLTIPKLMSWYHKQLADRSKEFVRRAEKSYKVVERSLKEIQIAARDLKDDTDSEDPETAGISTRFAIKVDEIVTNFDIKREITYENTEAMMAEIQRFIQELWGAGARWIRRMDKRHKSTIKQLDVYMGELSKEMKTIGSLLYEFSWVKDLERIGGRIKALEEITLGKEQYAESVRQICEKLQQARAEFGAAERELNDFKARSNVSEILNLDAEADRIQGLLRMRLNTLRKPVKKFMQHDTGVRIGPDGQKALTEYFEQPLKAILADADGYPALCEGLGAVKESVLKGTLPLKDRRLERRTVEEIDEIRAGSLRSLQMEARALDERRRAFAGSEVYAAVAKLEGRYEEAKKNLEYHTNDLLRVKDEIRRQLDKLKEFKAAIESDILKFFKEQVTIEMGETLEPLLDKCS